ncbi:hypothetical protein BC830DRAFT_514668 [Chytriomyces sp. MP71]|nr:hypothetical protein BC830DRAFT_514668 [Chytriomyces sp. MP71]
MIGIVAHPTLSNVCWLLLLRSEAQANSLSSQMGLNHIEEAKNHETNRSDIFYSAVPIKPEGPVDSCILTMFSIEVAIVFHFSCCNHNQRLQKHEGLSHQCDSNS